MHAVYTSRIYIRVNKITRTFKSGNSVAVRLPASLGVKAGEEMRIREDQGRYVLEPVGDRSKKIDLTGIYGSRPGLKPLNPEDRLFEERKLDWDGKLLGRG